MKPGFTVFCTVGGNQHSMQAHTVKGADFFHAQDTFGPFRERNTSRTRRDASSMRGRSSPRRTEPPDLPRNDLIPCGEHVADRCSPDSPRTSPGFPCGAQRIPGPQKLGRSNAYGFPGLSFSSFTTSTIIERSAQSVRRWPRNYLYRSIRRSINCITIWVPLRIMRMCSLFDTFTG